MKAIKLVFGCAMKYRGQLFIAILAMVGLVALQLLVPWTVRSLLVAVRDDAGTGEPARLALLLIGVFVGRLALSFCNRYFSHVAGWHVVSDVRHRLYEHLQRLSLRFHDNQKTGSLMSRVINDSDMFERLIAHAVPDTLVNVLLLIGVSSVLSVMNWRLMLLTLIPVPFILWTMRLLAKHMRPAFRARQADLADLNATLNDNLSGIREIKAFTREERESSRVRSHIARYRDSMLRTLRLMAFFGPLVELTASTGTVIVVYFGGRLALQGALAIEDLVAFFLYLEMFYQPVRALSGAWEQTQEAMAGADRVADLLEHEPEKGPCRSHFAFASRPEGIIRFDNVSFAYSDERWVLRDIDLTVPAHAHVALVGPTGAGKTTLASLVPRFYDVNRGVVTFDGHDVHEIPLQVLREQISLVLQDVFLFNGTVRENIMFANPDASEEQMEAAGEAANVTEFLGELPDGYDTMIGERGVKLSGGQKQRISIARALLKDAPVLILDEATSAVDAYTENLIQQALKRLMEGRTTITIAHRLSTVRNADLIVVLSEGRMVESGTHEELLADGTYYREITEMQRMVSA
ncbi:MAG: ATP-binding cassette domain-containing protein [Chitinivibrionales bacterium]|nr:ATP-binding cassette domain-containing protein [Chitinivibrionales bacterium]